MSTRPSTFDLTAVSHPFRTEHIRVEVEEGLTVEEMMLEAVPDPFLRDYMAVAIEGHIIPKRYWHAVRPHAGVKVTARAVPQGGDKNPLAIILSIVVIAVAAFAGPLVAGALGLTAGTTAFAAVSGITSALITVGGSLLVNAIAPIRPPSSNSQAVEESPVYFIEGARNTLRPYQVVPVVWGTHRQVPPLGAASYTEIIGEDQYLRVLVVWGYGPLKIEQVRIGETPLEEFDDVDFEHREGRDSDLPLTLFPSSVAQDGFDIGLLQSASWQTRTTGPDADEISVDFLWPRGLFAINEENGEKWRQITTLEIDYRKVGDVMWLEPIFTATTLTNASSITGNQLNIVGRTKEILRHGLRWSTPERAQYEVRIRRVDQDNFLVFRNTFDEVKWTALRTFTDEEPISFGQPLAKTALRIRATDQLNSVVDNLNAVVSSYALDWDGATWAEAVTSNPASIFRMILQGPANRKQLTDDRISLTNLQAWHDYCAVEGFECNMVRDFSASVWDALADVASTGRASPAQLDGKWGVINDVLQTLPVQHFTPRNSSNFRAEKTFSDEVHALRVQFNGNEVDWRRDEITVYDDGFDASNATEFLTYSPPGVTLANQAWKFGRFFLAHARLRPERFMIDVDFEHIVCRRGSLVSLAHDVMLVGVVSGRIKSLTMDGLDAVGMTSDELLTMEAGKEYGVVIRAVGGSVSRKLKTLVGSNATVEFDSPILAAELTSSGLDSGDPGVPVGFDNLFSFGLFGSETLEGLVLSVQPSSNFAATLTLVPYSRDIYTADTGAIPPYNPGLTPLATVPNTTVASVQSDESVLELDAGGSLLSRIAVNVEPVSFAGVALDGQIRLTQDGGAFKDATIVRRSGSNITFGDVDEGDTYDLRVRWNSPDRLPGKWTTVFSHTVVGQSSPPAALQNFTLSVYGSQAFVRWDRPSELGVRNGGTIQFRHTPELDESAAQWVGSTSIGDGAQGDDLKATLPLKPGTYLARTFDRRGRPSETVAKVSTKQANVLPFSPLGTVTEHPTFPGTKTDVVATGGNLQLSATTLIDDIPDFDAMGSMDILGGIALLGQYDFDGSFDLGLVKRVRVTTNMVALSVNVLDNIDERDGTVDTWENFDGTDQASTDAIIQVRVTDDDPAGSPTWSSWERIDAAEFETRALEFRALLSTSNASFNIRISELSVTVEETT